jgi:hypothetical protein
VYRGSASFLGQKRPNLVEIMRNEERMAWEWAEIQVLGKRGITQEHVMILLRFFLQNTAGDIGNQPISSIFQFFNFEVFPMF